jgi:hypothetical protein
MGGEVTDEEAEQEIADIASKFEAVKIAMTQDKNGHILKLSVHPNDTPEDLMRDPVGTRYMVVMVRIGDEGEAIASPTVRDGIMAVNLAGALARDSRFQAWLVQQEMADVISEPAAADAIRTHCAITSRSKLKTDAQARRRFLALRDEFANDLRTGIIPKG